MEADLGHWDLINTAWKAATTILVLRFLYFGRPQLSPHSRTCLSPAPSNTSASEDLFISHDNPGTYYEQIFDLTFDKFSHAPTDTDPVPDCLTASPYLHNSPSPNPSPLPSPLHYTDPPTSQLWNSRYTIHKESFNTLSTTLSALAKDPEPIYIRYFLLPIIILALVSRPHSKERAMCLAYFTTLDDFLRRPSTSPVGGENLPIDIPWAKLDAYSEAAERETRNGSVLRESTTSASAPEWNWWDMLRHTELNLTCMYNQPSFWH
jgi:hypothetical protein